MPARLHHERISRSDATPTRWLLLTHGIYGSGSNWRGIARKLTERRPEWGVVLVDLREHGRSVDVGAEPPHTVAACADDLRALIEQLDGVGAIAGHSFGGKVVLATRPLVDVAQTWVLDSSPSARPGALSDHGNSVVAVLEMMERLPSTWARRDDFIAAVLAAGHAPALASWLAMNVVPDATGALALRLDLAAMRALLVDYYARDLWAATLDPSGGAVEVMVATRSTTLSADDRARLAQAPPHVRVHTVEAGHWLHIEAAAQVVEALATQLPA